MPFPGISYAFSQPIDMRVQEMIIGARGDVVVKIFGHDIATLNQLAREVDAVRQGHQGQRATCTRPAERRRAVSDRRTSTASRPDALV